MANRNSRTTLIKLSNQLIKLRSAIQLQRRANIKPSMKLVTSYNWVRLQIEMLTDAQISFA